MHQLEITNENRVIPKRELAKITAAIRVDAVKARAHVLQKLLETEDANEAVQLSYAVSSLEKTALAVEEAERKREAFERNAADHKAETITIRFMDVE